MPKLEYLAQIRQRYRSESLEDLGEAIDTDSIVSDLKSVRSGDMNVDGTVDDSKTRATVINTTPIGSKNLASNSSHTSDNNQKDLSQVLLEKLNKIKNSPRLETEDAYKVLSDRINKEYAATNNLNDTGQEDEHKSMAKEWRRAMDDWTVTHEEFKGTQQAYKAKTHRAASHEKCDNIYKDMSLGNSKDFWEYFSKTHTNPQPSSSWKDRSTEIEYRQWLENLRLSDEIKLQMMIIAVAARDVFEKLVDLDNSNAIDRRKMTNSNKWFSFLQSALLVSLPDDESLKIQKDVPKVFKANQAPHLDLAATVDSVEIKNPGANSDTTNAKVQVNCTKILDPNVDDSTRRVITKKIDDKDLVNQDEKLGQKESMVESETETATSVIKCCFDMQKEDQIVDGDDEEWIITE